MLFIFYSFICFFFYNYYFFIDHKPAIIEIQSILLNWDYNNSKFLTTWKILINTFYNLCSFIESVNLINHSDINFLVILIKFSTEILIAFIQLYFEINANIQITPELLNLFNNLIDDLYVLHNIENFDSDWQKVSDRIHKIIENMELIYNYYSNN